MTEFFHDSGSLTVCELALTCGALKKLGCLLEFQQGETMDILSYLPHAILVCFINALRLMPGFGLQ